MTLKDSNSRLCRWALHLMTYDFEIRHRAGKLIKVADALSRITEEKRNSLYINAVHDESNEEIIIPKMDIIWTSHEIYRAQQKDKEIVKIIQLIKTDTTTEFYLGEEDKILYKTRGPDERHDKIVVPMLMRERVLQLHHDVPMSAHLRTHKTLASIQTRFYWKGMTADIKRYVEKCESCALRSQAPILKAPLINIPVPFSPFDKLAMDIVGPLNLTSSGNKYILTCIDYLTRYAEAIPIPDITTKTVARAFAERVIARHGTPRILITDRGSQFVSGLFKEICDILQIKKLFTLPYSPGSNGVNERLHRTLKTMISHYVTETDNDWDASLPFMLMAYNNTCHKSLNETPFFLMHGRDMNVPIDIYHQPQRIRYDIDDNYAAELYCRLHKAFKLAKQNLENAAAKQTESSKMKKRNRSINVGEKVYVKLPSLHNKTNLAPKFRQKFEGPYRVIKICNPVTYEIENIITKKIIKVHINKLKKCVGDDSLLVNDDNRNSVAVSPPNWSDTEADDEQQFHLGIPESEPEIYESEAEVITVDESSEEDEHQESGRHIQADVEVHETRSRGPHLRSHGPAPEQPHIYQGRV